MRLAVTGATGFLGRHLVRAAVDAGHSVRALIRPAATELHRLPQGVQVVEGQLPDALPQTFLNGADALIHLAAAGVQWEGRSQDQLHAVNVLGPVQLLRAAKEAGVSHVVLVGTALEYAGHGTLPSEQVREVLRCRETDSLETSDRYGAAKAAGGLLARSEARRLQLPTWYLRLCSVYGPGDRPTKLVPAAFHAARALVPFQMTAGEQLRDWLQVNDAVAAVLRAAERRPETRGETLNVGSGEPVALSALIEAVFSACGTDPALIHRGAVPYRAGEVHQLVLDASRGQAALDWRPKVDLHTGLGLLASSS